MSTALDSLREAMQAGDVLLSTPRRDILASQLTPALVDVTATVWNANTEAWAQHFTECLDEPAVRAILKLTAPNVAMASLHV